MASLETTRGLDARTISRIRRNPQQALDIINNVDVPSKINYRASESYTPQTAPQSRRMNVPTDMYGTSPATRKRRSTNGSYKIQKGDTLSAIAKRYGTTVQAIAEANGIADVNKIYVGDSLNIPGNATARTTTAPTQRTNTSATSTNQNMRARQNVTTETTNTSTQKSNNTVSLQTSSSEQDIDNEIDYIRHKLHAATTDKERDKYMTQLGQLFKRKDVYNAARRIDLAQQVGRVPKQLSTTSTINNNFSKSDMAAIRQDQNRRSAVIYNTRSKPSLRRNQRYSRTGDTRAIRYNKNRPRTWNDYKNQKAGWISELYS